MTKCFGFPPLCMYGMTSPSRESLVCALAIVAGDTWSKTETALVWTVRLVTAWNLGTFMPISPSSVLLILWDSFLTANGILVSLRTGLMMSKMVAYDNTTGSSLSVSLSLSNLQFGSGHQLKASVALLVLPNLYMMLKLKKASSLRKWICDAPNLTPANCP